MIARIVAAMTVRLETLEREKREKEKQKRRVRTRTKNISRGAGRYIGKKQSSEVVNINKEIL